MNNRGLDERQTFRRNQIGNQAFLMLLYLLLFDTGLYGFGFRWVSYPANIIIILTICSAIYIIRLIKGNAYVGPSSDKEKQILKVVLYVVIAATIAMTAIILLKNANLINNNKFEAMTAPILFTTSGIAAIIVIITAIIKKIQNRNDLE
ncbi:MAG: hypothetical protein K0S75_3048 [Clostridia bacterium]|jgi:hypothetical protein|nr:hypothetical protein [Clostridia bacterium]